jgi:hypothetical protein
MEIILTTIGVIVAMIAAENRHVGSMYVAVALVLVPWILGWALTESKVIVHTDVTEHSGTVYSVPKTFIETHDVAPFWSCQSSSDMVLKD